MEKYALTITYSNDDFKVAAIETIEGQTLIELCARFPLIIVQLSQKIALEKERKKFFQGDDDIPF